jgi:hypothetical protein
MLLGIYELSICESFGRKLLFCDFGNYGRYYLKFLFLEFEKYGKYYLKFLFSKFENYGKNYYLNSYFGIWKL